MIEIKPFRGIGYNKEFIKNLSLVIAPPYDVISQEQQGRLYDQSPYNIVRLIRGKDEPLDNEYENSASRANNYFQEWLKKRILIRDSEESFYACQDEYRMHDGTKRTRKGFIALFKLKAFGEGGIYPHERTLAGPKEDRFRLMNACSANFSSVFSLYTDHERLVDKVLDEVWPTAPDIEVLSQERIVYRLWKVSNPKQCKGIITGMECQNVFIADGHHRYETALNYQQYMRGLYGSGENVPQPYDFCLMYFSNTADEGLSILPYHRMVRNISIDILESLEERLREWFDIRCFAFDGIVTTEAMARNAFMKALVCSGAHRSTFGLYKGNQRYSLLVLKPSIDIEEIVTGEGSREWKSLDVNILHQLIFERVLGITKQDFEKKQTLAFDADLIRVLDQVNTKSVQAAFLVNPTKIEQVEAVALHGERMPQKSTFFFPKLPSGLVLRRIE